MKHKAQEAIKCIALNYDAEYVNECNDDFCKMMKGKIDTVQKTTDCQLTKEEINVIQICMSYYSLRHNEKPEINGINVDYCEDLFNKLQKQKEMWEVE